MATTQVIRSESFPDLGDELLFPRLSDNKLAWLGKRGTRATFQPGEVLYAHAVRDSPFYVIERGLVEFVDHKPGKDVVIAQADGPTFIGDIAAFTGEPTLNACVAVEPTDVIAFDRAGLRDMVARWPELGEMIFKTLDGLACVERGRRPRCHAPDRTARLAPVVRGARPARAEPDPRALVRRRHGRRERGDARVARHPALRDAGAGARDRR